MQTHISAKESASHASKPFFGSQSARSTTFFSSSPMIQTKLAMGAPGMLQAKSEDATAGVPASVEQNLRARHAGHSLDAPLQARMEHAFQADFSSVRVHTDGAAEQLNHELHARAFTHGNDIYFNAGEFAPDSRDGQHLLAHELTHVVQQSGSQGPSIQRACGTAAIGTHAGCTTHMPIFLEGYPTFKFAPDCDTFAAGQEAALVAHASGLPAIAAFEVHGYSTPGGDSTYNQNLSCARAEAAQRALTAAPPGGAGIPTARISGVFAHGETPGSPASTRASVVITPPRPTPMPSAVPGAGATDFAINRVENSTTSRIFFSAGSAALDTGAKSQISALKSLAPGTVRVIGFVSAGETDTLAQTRADSVKAALTTAPKAVTVSSAVGTPVAMKETSDFAEARSVEIVVGSAAPTKLNCGAKDPLTHALINPPTQSCATMDTATDTAFKAAHPIARDAMTRAVAAVAGTPNAVAAPLLDRFFGNHDTPTLTTLRANLGKLQTNVNALSAITECGGQCDKECDRGSTIAYHTQADVIPPRMVLCVPKFRGIHANDQPRNLIHETAHGTSPLGGAAGKGTRDLAYRHERMLFHLSTADRLRNSDSYALFAMFLREAQIKSVATAVPAGIATPSSDTMPGISPAEKPAMDLALARLEKRLTWCETRVGQLYGQVNDIRGGTQTWLASSAEDLMIEAAKRFPLTAPRATPSLADQTRVAAILDRYIRMRAAVKRDLTVTKAASGVASWTAAPAWIAGASLSVGPDFFRAAPRDQVALLLESLARVTRDVEPAFVPAYVTLAEWIHSNNS